MSPTRSDKRLIRLGVLSLSVTGTLLNMRLKSIIDPHYSSSQTTSGKALVDVLISEEYRSIDSTDYHRLLQCFCLTISSLTHGFPTDTNLEKFIYATAVVFSDPEQDAMVVQALLQVISSGYRRLRSDLEISGLNEQELHGTLFRHLYVTIKRLERILAQYNESKGVAERTTGVQSPQANLRPVTV